MCVTETVIEMGFLNPFSMKNRDQAAAEVDVVVPLAQARRHISNEKSLDADAEAGSQAESVWTLEALRAEIEQETAVSGHDEIYDRTYTLLFFSGS